MVYIVARSVQQGRTAGFASVLGVELGSLVPVAAAALGLSAVLAASAASAAEVTRPLRRRPAPHADVWCLFAVAKTS